MRYIPKTKIIATIGPSISEDSIFRKIITAGVDVIRINFSHGTFEDFERYIELVLKFNKKLKRRVRILGDLEGARIRIGYLREKILLRKNQRLTLKKGIHQEGDDIPVDYNGNLKDVLPAKFIYIDDGNIVLKILSVSEEKIEVSVVRGEFLKSRKGINIPDSNLKFPSLEEKDIKNIEFINKTEKFDYVALSFVRKSKDIIELRKKLKDRKIKIVAKIEDREGIKNIEKIIDVSDGIMIARGDMGISIPIYQVPFVQKEIIKKCKKKNKFSIVATQMLESMVENPIPTRAEVSDIANAVIDGADYLMLSAETSIGECPYEAVRMMNEIIKYSEIYPSSLSF